MLDQILDIVKENAGDLIVNNSDIDNKFNENAISGAAESISKGLQEQLNQGNV